MIINDVINNTRRRLSEMLNPELKAKPSDVIAGFINPTESRYGKMQPTDYQEQVEANESWVYACVAAIAESCALAQLKLYIARGDKTEEIKDHIFLDVMSNVNPFMNAFELREITETFQLLTGNAYWYLSLNGVGVPAEIWIVPAQDMKIVPDPNNFIKGYIYQPAGSTPIAFSPEEIVHFKYTNPNNMFYGMSPLIAAAYAVDTDKYMSQYQATSFKNGALPAGLLSSDQVISQAEADRMRQQWKQLYGGTNKAGKVAILSRGLKFENITMSAQEMSYVQSKNINRDTILGIFRVPKSILGLVEDVNRANAEASEYTFALRNIQPKLKRFQEKINEKIMPLYKQSGTNKLFVEFGSVVPANRELEITERNARLNTGYSTINEERENDGLEPVEWGSVPILPLAVAPLGSEPEAPAEQPPAAAPKPPAEEEASAAEAAAAEAEKNAPKRNVDKYFTRARVFAIYKARFDRETYNMRSTMQRLFRKQEKEVMDNLDKYAGKSFEKDASRTIIFDINFWEKEFAEVAGVDIDDAYIAGVEHGAKLIGIAPSIRLTNPTAELWLKNKKFIFSFNTNKTTQDQLRAELNAGLTAGETVGQLKDRVQNVFNFAQEFRAMRIARTEISDAENKGILDQWNKEGGVEWKEWLHGGGGYTPRENHIAMNDERVKMSERFSNGLLYPGDQSTDQPGETINCTCTMLPIIEK